ncbi:MAG TPA: type II toxin-antitoxin system VapC family toxin [Thermoanaerobaculia bacterium]|nr:type II toxin-antitoxin system VapC family toxin [Thermoanaerobaculia bacterium]
MAASGSTQKSGRYLLDTNIVTALFKQDAAIHAGLAAAEEVLLPSTVLGELYYGAARSARRQENVERLEEFAATCTVLATDGQTARVYGRIKDELRSRGRPIPDNDLWIAASARQHGLVLVTRDHHFKQVDGIQTEAW